MSNSYKYSDHDNSYRGPAAGLIKNLRELCNIEKKYHRACKEQHPKNRTKSETLNYYLN